MSTTASFPQALTIEATSSCQLRCPACPTPTGLGRPRGFFSVELFEVMLEQVQAPLSSLSFSWSGEPMLNVKLPQMIALGRGAGLFTYMCTNGMLLERHGSRYIEAGLDLLRVSVDGIDQAMSEKYRVGADFALIWRGIEAIANQRAARNVSVPRISLQMLITKDTEAHRDAFVKLATDCGADEVYFKSFDLTMSDWLTAVERQQLADTFLPSDQAFLRYQRDDDGTWQLRPELRATECAEITSGATILHNGDVVICCEDFKANHVMGNIRRTPLAEIWSSEAYAAKRVKVLNRELDLCRDCSYPGSNRYNQMVTLTPVSQS